MAPTGIAIRALRVAAIGLLGVSVACVEPESAPDAGAEHGENTDGAPQDGGAARGRDASYADASICGASTAGPGDGAVPTSGADGAEATGDASSVDATAADAGSDASDATTTLADVTTPTDAPSCPLPDGGASERVTAIGLSEGQGCARMDDGTLSCWRSDTGDGTQAFVESPVPVPGLVGVVAVSSAS